MPNLATKKTILLLLFIRKTLLTVVDLDTAVFDQEGHVKEVLDGTSERVGIDRESEELHRPLEFLARHDQDLEYPLYLLLVNALLLVHAFHLKTHENLVGRGKVICRRLRKACNSINRFV